MGLPNSDEIKGKGKQVTGAVKEKVGQVVGNRDLETEGAAENAEGDAQETVGKVRRKVGEAITDVGNAIGR
jgi:uncharacterized protein YjbJ (UPF0337 family)